jgi:primosomal protein N' (replication factor Y)
VVGTRAAAFAPVHDLGLVAIWDDGDDLHAEPARRTPRPRGAADLATVEGAAAVVGGFACSVEAEQLLATGWAHELTRPARPSGRGHRLRVGRERVDPPRPDGAVDADARAGSPRSRLAGARPVSSTPRAAGTPRPWPASAAVRSAAVCTGPLGVSDRRPCPPAAGAHRRGRLGVLGLQTGPAPGGRERRTAEVGAAPSPPSGQHGRDHVVASVPRPAVVVATPGPSRQRVATPPWSSTPGLPWPAPDLRTEEEASAAGAAAWAGDASGFVVVVGDRLGRPGPRA